MKLIKPSVKILTPVEDDKVIETIANVARTCYKSEANSTKEKDEALVKRLIESKHEAMLEFVDITVKFTCSRAISHELIRHRLCSFAQESQRYCNYSKDKFDNEITFIIPSWLDIPEGNYTWWDNDWVDMNKLQINLPDNNNSVNEWLHALHFTEQTYNILTSKGWKAEQAREVLPNSTKTEINMKANLREWRHFLNLRCSTAAHPDMRALALDLLKQLHRQIPIIFDDIYDKYYDSKI